MRTRKEILESRIARLEKLLAANKPVKNEALDIDEGEIESLAEEIMMDAISADYRWGQDAQGQIDFMREFDKLADGRNPALVNEVVEEMANDLDVSPRELRPFKATIARVASECAADILDAYCVPDGDAPERWVEWMDDLGVDPDDMPERCRKIYFDVVGRNECGGRRCESRKLNRRSMKRRV